MSKDDLVKARRALQVAEASHITQRPTWVAISSGWVRIHEAEPSAITGGFGASEGQEGRN
jgi:hypothetical protein